MLDGTDLSHALYIRDSFISTQPSRSQFTSQNSSCPSVSLARALSASLLATSRNVTMETMCFVCSLQSQSFPGMLTQECWVRLAAPLPLRMLCSLEVLNPSPEHPRRQGCKWGGCDRKQRAERGGTAACALTVPRPWIQSSLRPSSSSALKFSGYLWGLSNRFPVLLRPSQK